MRIPARSQHPEFFFFLEFNSLLLMAEKLKKSLGNNGVSGMLLTDLSKIFDCLRDDLLIARLAAYGFDQPSLCFIFSYLSDITQRTKVNNAYSSYADIKVLY